MNTRLQVEHPVTECVTGVGPRRAAADRGRGRRPRRASAAAETGHAVEVRLYAEDPAARLPAAERPADPLRDPGATRAFERLRDVGRAGRRRVRAGDEVGTHYDAMLAKVVCWAPDPRARRCAGWPARWQRAEIHGVRTNRDLLVEVLRHEAFVDGRRVHRLPRAARPRRPAPRPVDAGDAASVGASPRRSPSPSGRVRAAPCSAASRPAGATSSPQPQRTAFDATARRSSRVATAAATGYRVRDGTCAPSCQTVTSS